LVDIIVDGAESAKSLNRPGMARLLARSLRRSAGCYHREADRLTRSVKDLCTLLGRFERRGVAGWSLHAESGTACSLLCRRSLLDEGDDVTFDLDALICGAFLVH
jgi:DNA invertase Pin-like site-specific DNA recombinase